MTYLEAAVYKNLELLFQNSILKSSFIMSEFLYYIKKLLRFKLKHLKLLTHYPKSLI